MPIAFERSKCCDLNETISREWLITNGLGGYASGTISGILTRMQHGLLVTPGETATPQLLLAKIDEEIVFDERTYYLGTNEYRDGTLNPCGFVHLETFRLEEGFPVFTYHLGGVDGIVLEKRIWMPHGYNTTYIQYRVLRMRPGSNQETDDAHGNSRTADAGNRKFGRPHGYSEAAQRELSLTLLPFAAYRPHNQPQYGNNDWHFQVQAHSAERQTPLASRAGLIDDELFEQFQLPKGVAGCTIRAWDTAPSYSLFAIGHADSQTTFIPTGVWYWHFLRRHDRAAGRPAVDDLYLPGVIRAKLWPGEDVALTIVVTTEELSSQTFSQSQLNLSYKRSVGVQNSLVSRVIQPQRYFGEGGETAHFPQLPPFPQSREGNGAIGSNEFYRLLLQAADRFLIHRTLPRSERTASQPLFLRAPENIPLILSDYYSLEDNTRDSLIALPGLTLVTKQYEVALRILRSFARYFKQGLLPDRLPQTGHPLDERDYGSVDTTLWFFYALDHYIRATQDYELLDELYQPLVESINWYIKGTFNGIQLDTNDGLLRAQQPRKALTWMNSSINGTPVTPRHGKAVEVNALWYHALKLMQEWSHQQHQLDYAGSSPAPTYYLELAVRCKQSFQQRFWNDVGGYLYDVIDGPDGNDASFRPNQILALSLRYPVLEKEYRKAILELVTQHLVTPYGLRTLAPHEPGYRGQLLAKQEDVQRALHQGSAWSWLIGPYIDALIGMQDASSHSHLPPDSQHYGSLWQRAIAALEPFREQFSEGALGMIGGVFNGDAPYYTGFKATSAMSIGEILRVYNHFVYKEVQHPIDLVHGLASYPSNRREAVKRQTDSRYNREELV